MRVTHDELAQDRSRPRPEPFLGGKIPDAISTLRHLHRPDPRVGVIVGSGPSGRLIDFANFNSSRLVTFAINEEAWNTKGAYAPDFWIFCDPDVGKKRCDQLLPSSRTRVLTRKDQESTFRNGRIAVWLRETLLFKLQNVRGWSPTADWLPAQETTATAAAGMAVMMGLKKIILVGIDCFGSKSLGYYRDGRIKDRSTLSRGSGDHYVTQKHERMIQDWVEFDAGLRRWGWDGRIIQTSLASPLTVFQKMRWQEAAR